MDVLHKQVSTTARLEVVLYLVAIGSFVFGVGDIIAGPFALAYGNDIAWSFSYIWGGFVFAIINGSLALRAVCNKPQVNAHWAKVCFGFGIAALVMHCADLILAAVGLGIYGSTYYFYYYLYRPVTYSAGMPEVARLVMVTCLVALDSLEIHFTKKFMSSPLCRQGPACGFQTVQYVQQVQPGQSAQFVSTAAPVAHVQVPMQMQMQMQPGATAFTNQAGQMFVLTPASASNVGFSTAVLSSQPSAAPTVDQRNAPSSSIVQGSYSATMPPAYQDKY